MIELRDITYQIGRKRILHGVHAQFDAGKLSVILGPNGSGKSTMLRIMAGLSRNHKGEVSYHSSSIRKWNEVELAKNRAVLLQEMDVSLPFSVKEIIMMGRYPHHHGKASDLDYTVYQSVIDELGLQSFQSRNYAELSGGEKQRVHFARVLTQLYGGKVDSKILILDEPTNNLDIKYQIELLSQAKKLARQGMTVVAVLHDLNLALEFADYVLFLKNGYCMAEGAPEEVMKEHILKEVYDVDLEICRDVFSNQLFIKQAMVDAVLKE